MMLINTDLDPQHWAGGGPTRGRAPVDAGPAGQDHARPRGLRGGGQGRGQRPDPRGGRHGPSGALRGEFCDGRAALDQRRRATRA